LPLRTLAYGIRNPSRLRLGRQSGRVVVLVSDSVSHAVDLQYTAAIAMRAAIRKKVAALHGLLSIITQPNRLNNFAPLKPK